QLPASAAGSSRCRPDTARPFPGILAPPPRLWEKARTDSHSCRAVRPALPARARFPPPDFPTCTRVFAECAREPSGQSSFSELPFELIHFVFAEQTPCAWLQLFIFERADAHAPEFFHRMANR